MVEELSKKYIIKKARVDVTKDNYKLLQVLDLLTDYYDLIEENERETKKALAKYLSTVKIKKDYFEFLMDKYPEKTSKTLLSKGYLDLFLRGKNLMYLFEDQQTFRDFIVDAPNQLKKKRHKHLRLISKY